QAWHGKKYLDQMHQARMLDEIDAAHRMGIDVFVLDTGWYQKTGDRQVNRDRFPDGLKTVGRKLNEYGMKMGLWFDNAAAVSSQMLQRHLDCRISSKGVVPEPSEIWETEKASRMCLVSR